MYARSPEMRSFLQRNSASFRIVTSSRSAIWSSLSPGSGMSVLLSGVTSRSARMERINLGVVSSLLRLQNMMEPQHTLYAYRCRPPDGMVCCRVSFLYQSSVVHLRREDAYLGTSDSLFKGFCYGLAFCSRGRIRIKASSTMSRRGVSLNRTRIRLAKSLAWFFEYRRFIELWPTEQLPLLFHWGVAN